jgi:signal transduction histidine kinase
VNSERARLTTLYGALLILAGVLLTGLVYLLLRNSLPASIGVAVAKAGALPDADRNAPLSQTSSPHLSSGQTGAKSPGTSGLARPSHGLDLAVTKQLSAVVNQAALKRALTDSGVALGLYAIASVGLAWWMAGRVLRPVGVITARARRLSGTNLHERLRLRAPPGELKELADTFDGMLDRIERLVAAQQRFAANAAHQLRTPLTVQRAAAEIGLAGDPAPHTVARIRRKLIENAQDSERLIEGLLLLATSDEGIAHREPVKLDDVVSQVVTTLAPEAQRKTITVDVDTESAIVEGDAVLLGQLVHNLVSNALIHNHRGGTVRVRVSTHDVAGAGAGATNVGVVTAGPVVEVANTGPIVPADSMSCLFEPFHGARERRYSPGQGAGLGLSIVASIARAHAATTTATPNPHGGLTVRVTFAEAA